MYEEPIKRAGISMNRILYSNTKMVYRCFSGSTEAQFNTSFKFRLYTNGKATSTKCKFSYLQFLLTTLSHLSTCPSNSPAPPI